MKIRSLVIIFFMTLGFASKAQTLTDPWATLGASNIQTAFIAMDASNNLYVTNFINSTISKITPGGTVTQAWATLATNSYPYGIVIDASGNLYTVNRGPKTISKITPSGDGTSGSVIQTWANLGGDEAYTIAIDASGNLFAPYVSRNRIAKIIPNGATGTINTSWVTLATNANPFSISFDASGNLYSANSNNTISKINPAGSKTDAWATLATGANPQFMVFDPTGNMYVSCWGTSTVSKINSSGSVTNVWSLGTSVWPAGIVLDDEGNIYTANYNNHTVSKITSSGTVSQAYVTLATGSYPFYIAKDANGNFYTTNMGNGTVSKITNPPSYTSSYGQKVSLADVNSIISTEGGANFGTGRDIYGKRYNITGITSTKGTVASTTAVLGGVISPTNAISSSVGVRYSTDINFGTYSTTIIQSNVSGGTYTSSISGLASSTNYYAKAFVTNSAGTNLGEVVSFTTTPPTALDAIVLNLDATNTSSYGGNGSIWNDLSGQNNTATFTNIPTYSSNPGSLTFSTASYATTISSTINLTTATFVAWVNPSQIQSNYTGIIYLPKSSTDLNNRYGMQFRTNNSVGYTWGMNGATTYNWDSQLYTPNNQWSMVAISVSANSTTAFLCNASGITSAVNIDTHAAASGFKYYVGRDPISYSSSEADLRSFKGNISRVSVYGATLTQADITSIFNAQKAAFGIN